MIDVDLQIPIPREGKLGRGGGQEEMEGCGCNLFYEAVRSNELVYTAI